jgi:hypothetical protein
MVNNMGYCAQWAGFQPSPSKWAGQHGLVAQKRTGELPRSHGTAGGGWSNPAAPVDVVWWGAAQGWEEPI